MVLSFLVEAKLEVDSDGRRKLSSETQRTEARTGRSKDRDRGSLRQGERRGN